MRSLRTDFVILALIVSAVIHLGVMYFARSMVMTQVVTGNLGAAKRGPMRVLRAEERPEPVRIATVRDVEPAKAAPEAEKNETFVPAPDRTLPMGGEVAATVPEMPEPDLSAKGPAQVELPEVMTADAASEPMRAPQKAELPVAPKPKAVLAGLSAGTDEPLAVPTLTPVVPELSSAPTEAPVANLEVAAVRRATPSAYVPPTEVMERVDEKVVAAEKEAVRDLVNVSDAKDLAKAVDVKATRYFSPDGTHFRVTVTPKDVLRPVPKDVVVLIDASGSIGKERMGSIRGAAKRILRSAANTGDRFNLVAFRDRYSYAFRTWQSCTVNSFAAADRWINNVAPFGRTDVFATISSVLTLPREPTRPLIALVVTDGEANSGVSDTAEILARFTNLNDGLISVYMYGVKSSANRELIDVLTRGNRGESFIFEQSGWTARSHAGDGLEKLSNRFRDPVLSDLRVVFASDCMAETYPRILRNLYRGESVEILGRLPPNAHEIAFSLKGLNGDDAYEAFFRLPLDSAASDPRIPTLWGAERALDRRLR